MAKFKPSILNVDFIWRSEKLPYLIIRGRINWIIQNRKITFAARNPIPVRMVG